MPPRWVTGRGAGQRPVSRTAGLVLLLASLWGCTGWLQPDRDVWRIERALADRDAATERVSRTIDAYCSMRRAFPEARHACVVEHRLEVLRILHADAGEARAGISEEGRRPLVLSDRCERARFRTICERRGWP